VNALYSLSIRRILITAKNEGWSFILISAYLFFEYVRPQTVYTSLDILPWSQFIVILSIVSLPFEKDRYRLPSALSRLMVVYASVVLLSSFVSDFSHQAFTLANLRVFYDWVLVYFLIIKIINNERRFYIFLLSFLIYSFKMSQHGALSWAMQGFAFSDWGVTGAPGWFHNSGEVGIQMCIFVPMAVAFIYAVRKYVSQVWLLLLAMMPLTGVFTIIASASRGAMIGLFGSGIWAIIRRPKFFLYGLVFLGIASLGIYHLTPPEFRQRFEEAGEDRTSIVRMERWRQGLDAMRKNPIFGVGFGVWDKHYTRYYQTDEQGTKLVHNIFIQCGSELGYTGLIIFISMIVSSFFMTYRVRKLTSGQEDRFLPILSYGFDASMIGFLISAFFVTVLYYPYFWIQCALTVCLYTAASRKFAELQDTEINRCSVS